MKKNKWFYKKDKKHGMCKLCKKTSNSKPINCRNINHIERYSMLIKNSKKYHNKNRLKIIKILGGKCKKCGITDWRVLQINHINGGGRKELELNMNKFYKDILLKKRNIIDLDLRCANCNILYEYEVGRRSINLTLDDAIEQADIFNQLRRIV
jgi:hypothetical protein